MKKTPLLAEAFFKLGEIHYQILQDFYWPNMKIEVLDEEIVPPLNEIPEFLYRNIINISL